MNFMDQLQQNAKQDDHARATYEQMKREWIEDYQRLCLEIATWGTTNKPDTRGKVAKMPVGAGPGLGVVLG